MKELSLHILDIAMNSVKAGATCIEILIEEKIKENELTITIKDNGKGMDKETLAHVTDPFYTTRTTRKVGLGIPLFKEAAERCNGYLKIESELGKGTVLECMFERDNIDRAPMGNIGDTMMVLINSLADCELVYTHTVDGRIFSVSTVELKEILGGIDLNSSEILLWIKDYVNENINELY